MALSGTSRTRFSVTYNPFEAPYFSDWVPQVAVLRDLCLHARDNTQVCDYADLWHPD